MDVFTTILSSNLTPITLSLGAIAFIFLSYNRGWIMSSATVSLLLGAKDARIEDYKKAYELQLERGDKQHEILVKLLGYAEVADRILHAYEGAALSPREKDGATP